MNISDSWYFASLGFFFGIISILYTLVYIIDKINVVDILGIPRL